MDWLNAFFGTPQRLLWTLGIILGIAILIHPPLLAAIMNNIAMAIGPILGPVMTLFIIFIAFKIMLSGFTGGGGGGNKKKR